MPVTGERLRRVLTATGRVHGEPELRTPTGRAPIRPHSIDVTYDIDTGEVHEVIVRGDRLDVDPPREAWRPTVTRRIRDLEAAPEWVRVFVEKHRPIPRQES